MDPLECKLFFRESATRLVNFDPNFDDPNPEPLPLPWENRQSLFSDSQQGYTQPRQARATQQDDNFAYP